MTDGNDTAGNRFILLGPPGSGKGTQAAMLAERLGVPHIASGDLFRYHQREGTPLGQKAAEYMKKGLLVPDEITIQMALEKIGSTEGKRGFLLDGFPRNLVQARSLDDDLKNREQKVDKAILINVPEEELIQRLGGRLVCRNCQAPYHEENAQPKKSGTCDLCGTELYQRQDDTPKAIRVRIKVYQEETQPLRGYYKKADKLVEIDGIGPVDEIERRLLRAIDGG